MLALVHIHDTTPVIRSSLALAHTHTTDLKFTCTRTHDTHSWCYATWRSLAFSDGHDARLLEVLLYLRTYRHDLLKDLAKEANKRRWHSTSSFWQELEWDNLRKKVSDRCFFAKQIFETFKTNEEKHISSPSFKYPAKWRLQTCSCRVIKLLRIAMGAGTINI